MIKNHEKFLHFDELRIFQGIYNVNDCRICAKSFVPRNVFYQISTPFLMDSQTANWLDEKLGIEKKRKRKRKRSKIAEHLLEDVEFVQNVYAEFQLAMGYNEPANSSISTEQIEDIGNKLARQWVKNAPNFNPQMATGSQIKIFDIGGDKNIFSTQNEHPIFWKNRKAEFILADSHLIPPNSAFLCGDISLTRNFPKYGLIDFDFIILDPSWPNRTVKRQKSYETMQICENEPLEKLRQIPIQNLLKIDGILCIWITNSRTSHQWADELIEHWGLRKLAKWNWLKICKSGEAICPFRPEHKLPFESILLACKPDSTEKYSTIPKQYCLISVPNANPSRKPPISKLLEAMGHIEPVKNGLELFARYLLPNFTSTGFEALKFQNEYYFECIERFL